MNRMQAMMKSEGIVIVVGEGVGWGGGSLAHMGPWGVMWGWRIETKHENQM